MEIYNKANELAKLISESKELQTLRDAEAALMGSKDALNLINDFNSSREEYVKLLSESEDTAKIEDLKKNIIEKSELLQSNKLTKDYLESKTVIDNMFRTISDILSHAVNGDQEDGCGSDCGSGCGSCGCGGGCG